jgi:hypothetical protein
MSPARIRIIARTIRGASVPAHQCAATTEIGSAFSESMGIRPGVSRSPRPILARLCRWVLCRGQPGSCPSESWPAHTVEDRMPFATNAGVRIHWQERGEGTPLLLIMGHRFSARCGGRCFRRSRLGTASCGSTTAALASPTPRRRRRSRRWWATRSRSWTPPVSRRRTCSGSQWAAGSPSAANA